MIIKLKDRFIHSEYLTDDCNYEINTYNLIKIISYIKWSISELKLLNKYSLIDWNIYSNNDLSIKILDEFNEFINKSVYITYITKCYNIIPDYAINLFDETMINIFEKNKNFFLKNKNFLIKFKYIIDFYMIDNINFITDDEILFHIIDIIPLSVFESLITNLKFKPTKITISKIIKRFNFLYEKHNIVSLLS